MKFLGFEIKRNIKQPTEEMRSIYDSYEPMFGGLSFGTGTYSSFQSSKALTLSAVFRAVNLISDAIASLQMKIFQVDAKGFKSEFYSNELYPILSLEPNPNMGSFIFFKLIIQALLLEGNAYVKINRDDKFNVESLEFINPAAITIITPNNELKYIIAGTKGQVNNSDMIHIRNFPQINSHYGMSTIRYAMHTLYSAENADTHARNYFKGGANAAGLLTSDNALDPKQAKDVMSNLKSMSTTESGNPNGIAVLAGLTNPKLHTMGIPPKDSQLLETRAFNVLEIARFFNVNPILLFDVSKASFNNIENAQLDFLNTTLLPVIVKIENEFNRKLVLPSKRRSQEIRFDISNMLRADQASQAKYYTSLFAMGVVNANQVAKILNLPKIDGEGGDRHYISTNLQDSNNLIVNQKNSIDNKLLGDNKNNNNE